MHWLQNLLLQYRDEDRVSKAVNILLREAVDQVWDALTGGGLGTDEQRKMAKGRYHSTVYGHIVCVMDNAVKSSPEGQYRIAYVTRSPLPDLFPFDKGFWSANSGHPAHVTGTVQHMNLQVHTVLSKPER